MRGDAELEDDARARFAPPRAEVDTSRTPPLQGRGHFYELLGQPRFPLHKYLQESDVILVPRQHTAAFASNQSVLLPCRAVPD